jgi:hypothetical protein
MGMFSHSIVVVPFGELSADGKSKVWEGSVDIPALGQDFFIRIFGDESGPTQNQVRAYSQLLANADEIKEKSTTPIINFLNKFSAMPENITLSALNLWQYLEPSFIEVHESSEYSAGQGKEYEIAISIGFEVPWEAVLLQIGTIDGKFDAIYSE